MSIPSFFQVVLMIMTTSVITCEGNSSIPLFKSHKSIICVTNKNSGKQNKRKTTEQQKHRTASKTYHTMHIQNRLFYINCNILDLVQDILRKNGGFNLVLLLAKNKC